MLEQTKGFSTHAPTQPGTLSSLLPRSNSRKGREGRGIRFRPTGGDVSLTRA